MKNQLFTRNTFLGILMVLVLAFGMQGNLAHAQSVSVSGDGSTTSSSSGTTVITDYRSTPAVERSFTISVSSAKNGKDVTITPDGATITEVKVTSAPSPQTKFDNGDNPDSDSPTGTDRQISPAKGVIENAGDTPQITFNGLGKPDSTTATGSWTIKVTYTVAAFGKYSITIGGTADSDPSGSPITAYVVRSDSLARNLSFDSNSTDTPQVRRSSVTFDVGRDEPWFRVDLRVTGGKLYLDSGRYLSSNRLYEVTQRKEFTSLSMFTGTEGSVTANLIQNNGQVAKITATIPGSNARGKTYTVTSFDSARTVEQVSGNRQFGYTNQGSNYGSWTKLRNPLVVRVVDGHGTNKGVSGQWVTFIASGTGAPRLRAVSRADLWDRSGDGSISAVDDNQTSLAVKTDSSGRAQVYLLPGVSPATYTVTYGVSPQDSPTVLNPPTPGDATSSPSPGAINEQFTATAIRDIGTTRGYVISREGTTSTPQILRVGQLDTPLTVHADDGRNGDATNVQVDFSVSGGRITLTSGSNYQTSLSTVTDNNSNAKIWVQASGNSVAIVTARIVGSAEDAGRYVVTFLRKGPYIEIVSGNDKKGAIGGRLENPLVVRVLDGSGGSPIPNQIVKFQVTATGTDPFDHTTTKRQFIPVPGTYVFVKSASRIFDQAAGDTPADDSIPSLATALHPTRGTEPADGQRIFVQTDSNGQAQVYLRLGNGDNPESTDSVEATQLVHQVTATTPKGAPRAGVHFRADAVDDARQAKLEIVSGDGQSAGKGDPLANPLVVRVRTVRGFLLQGVKLEFTALDGTLLVDSDHDTELVTSSGGGNQIEVRTASDGEARVIYNVGQLRIARDVTVEVKEEQGTFQYDFAIDEVRFGVNGGQGTTPAPAPTPAPTPAPIQPTGPSLSADISGAPGSQQTLSVSTDATAQVTVGVATDTFLTAGGVVADTSFTGSRAVSITLPNTVGTYNLTVLATTTTTSQRRYTIRVVSPATTTGTTTGVLSLASVGAQVNGQQTIQVTARTSAGALVTTPVTVTLSGAGVSKTVSTTATGSVNTIIALPTTAGTLTASATGYTDDTLALPARTTTTTDTTPTTTPTTPTTTPTTPEPSSISISGPATRSGTVNEEIEAALLVQVLDADGEGVEDARVTFRVRTGQGRLSQRGNGRAIAVRTNAEGHARADYTPMSARSTVEASVTGVTRTATFTITATGSVPTTPDPGGTTGTTAIDPKILVGAGNRPAMVWVDNGMLYGLTGAEATKIAESVNGAAIGNGKVYWTEKTGASGGTINSANLDGTPRVTKLATIKAVPMGIAVDTANSKLYWTNSRGRVQSANLNGSGIRNVQQNLTNPSDIALGNGHIYWIEDGSSIRRVNMTGTKVVKDVAVGLTDVGGIAVGGGKVYWTEKTGASAGTISGANADGTQFKTLAKIKAVPMGIAVDTAGKKLYWTNSRGRVQSANLNGSSIRNVVDGLGTPSHLAIASASQVTTAKPTKPATQPTKKDTTAYDVNGDGTVDNTDASLVSEAMGTDNKKYDVNGDGTVNFFDLMLVFDNRDAEAAAAPTLMGIQLSSAQVDILQEQIDLLIATGDRSPAAMRTLIYLQQLIATARPEKTQLLANYPNPFNPETWIPYELATDTNVKITIYNAQGVVIRTLQLGQQSAGYYTDRERAAYWDGRNALGEQVASGIYFYQLETDNMSAMRKMVILK